MVDGSLPFLSPLGGGEGEDGKRGYRRQKTGDNFKSLLPMCKTSTPGPADHPRPRWTVGMRFRAVLLKCYVHPRPAKAGHPRQRWTVGMRFALFIKVFFTPASVGLYRHTGEVRYPENMEAFLF